jgi:hypothetical protein
MGCGTNTFPDGWVDLMMSRLTDLLDSPSGSFRDLNLLYRSWSIMKIFISQGLICEEDYPSGPTPSNYTDTNAPASPEAENLVCEVEYHCGGADSDMII